MKTFYWFTETLFDSQERGEYSFDLSAYLKVFVENKLWEKPAYRTEYKEKFAKQDLEKIQSIKIHFHVANSPFHNFHNYENIINKYFDIDKIEPRKIACSGIGEANRIAVIEIVFDSDKELIPELSYDEERDIELVIERLNSGDTWKEEVKIKSIACEFVQFFIFNLHLNFITTEYTFAFSDKPNPIGFTVVSKESSLSYSTEKLELLTHYILYQKEGDKLEQLMGITSRFWSKGPSMIHFFLDAVKTNCVTSTNFIKLVFALESFFGKNASNDFVSFVAPLAISENINEMKGWRETVRKSFKLRNEIVHGNSLIDLMDSYRREEDNQGMDKLFFELKSVIIRLFYFYINNDLFNRQGMGKINHELLFEFFPRGITKKSKRHL